ncbi:MAG: hypothetical protein NVSMB57_11400 [Actinomycetota bacterium]
MLTEVQAAYARYASSHNGMLDRPADFWTLRTLKPFGDATVYRYLVRENGVVTGWIVYTQEDGFNIRLQIRDLVATTPAAGRALVTFIARHHSLGNEAEWYGPPVEPLSFLFSEASVEIKEHMPMMVRLLDVPAALESRGYRDDVAQEVSFGVADSIFADNRGPWRLRVECGKASVEPVDNASMSLSINALSAIYTGFLSPSAAASVGMLSGPDPEIRRLESIFGGETPWITDYF